MRRLLDIAAYMIIVLWCIALVGSAFVVGAVVADAICTGVQNAAATSDDWWARFGATFVIVGLGMIVVVRTTVWALYRVGWVTPEEQEQSDEPA